MTFYQSQHQIVQRAGFEGGDPRIGSQISDRTRTEARKVQSSKAKDGVPGMLIATAEQKYTTFFQSFIQELLDV